MDGRESIINYVNLRFKEEKGHASDYRSFILRWGRKKTGEGSKMKFSWNTRIVCNFLYLAVYIYIFRSKQTRRRIKLVSNKSEIEWRIWIEALSSFEIDYIRSKTVSNRTFDARFSYNCRHFIIGFDGSSCLRLLFRWDSYSLPVSNGSPLSLALFAYSSTLIPLFDFSNTCHIADTRLILFVSFL